MVQLRRDARGHLPPEVAAVLPRAGTRPNGSLMLFLAIRSWYQERHSHWNACMALLNVVADAGAVYVEGWARPPVEDDFEPVEHGWIELADGTVLDPTPPWYETTARTAYFGAVRYSRAEVARRYEEEPNPEGPWLPFVTSEEQPDGRETCPPYAAAYRAARAWAPGG